MEIEKRTQSARWRWSILFAVVYLNVCLPSLVLSYGVLFVHSVNLGVSTWLSFSVPTIYILTYSLTQCWCRDVADSWGGPVGYRVMATVGLLFVVLSSILCAIVPLSIQPYIYGILVGFGSSLMSAQVDAVVFDTYDSRLEVIRAICWSGQAVGQSIFPHIISALVDYYGYSWSYLVLGGIMLQAMPVIMLLRVDNGIRRGVSYPKYSDLGKTYSIFSNDNSNNYELPLHDLSKKCWKSPSDDNLHLEGDLYDGENEILETITPPPSPEEKRRNIFGVEILPEIPEESEDDISVAGENTNKNKKRLSSAIKRLSIMGDNFEGYIAKQTRRDSQTDRDGYENPRNYTEVEVIYDNISPITDVQREKIFNSFTFRCQSTYASFKRSICIPSYKMYRIRRRFFSFIYKINDTFFKPLTRSFSCWRFYPALAIYFSKLSLTAIPLILLPMIAAREVPNIPIFESNFLLTIHGFTWICFLLTTPWLAQTSKRNFKYVAVAGLVISTAACFVLAIANDHDTLSIGCVVGGFGYGAVSSCWETAAQEFVGPRKWPKLHSTLETMSGSLLAAFVFALSFVIEKERGLQFCMIILTCILAFVSFMWIILSAISIYNSKIKSLKLGIRW